MSTVEAQSGDELRTYVLFRLDKEEYGLPIARVSSIIRYEEPTPVPQAPDSVAGVVNVRGHVIPIVNLMRALKGVESCPRPSSRIVITESDAGVVGVVVDAASEVVAVDPALIAPAPEAVLSEITASVFEGVVDFEGRLVILLRLENLLPKTDFRRPVPSEGEPDA
jgi:purine-binding chemotaxis protein CheW